MTVKLLTDHHLEFLSLKRGCKGLSEFTLAKMLHCWKSHVAAHIYTSIAIPKSSSATCHTLSTYFCSVEFKMCKEWYASLNHDNNGDHRQCSVKISM